MATSGKDPDAIIDTAEQERERESADAKRALKWFLDNEGEMYPRQTAVEEIADHLDVDEAWANRTLSSLVGDIADPVQQVLTTDGKFVGVISFQKCPDEGAYGFIDYDDAVGERKRVICARCVEQHDHANKVSHATAGEGSAAADADWQTLLNYVTSHYTGTHDSPPEDIEIGASLISNTTISSSKAWHAGNDGSGSGLNADKVQGRDLATEHDAHTGASEGVHGTGTSSVASQSDVSDSISDHTNNDVHGSAQPPQSHGNAAHNNDYAIPGVTNVEDFSTGASPDSEFIVNADGDVVAVSRAVEVHTAPTFDGLLGIDAEAGDYGKPDDEDKTYVFLGGDSSQAANWEEIDVTAPPVNTVFGREGDVTAQSGDYTHSQIAEQNSDDHHSKTSSASELTDVSADSVAGAHHSPVTVSTPLSEDGAQGLSILLGSGVSTDGNGNLVVNESGLSFYDGTNLTAPIDAPSASVGNETVATETWVNNNADVPNADYADSAGDADTLDGSDSSAFVTNRYSDSEAISAVEGQEIDNRNNQMLTDDIYIDDQGQWVNDHMNDSSAHHSRYGDGEARSAVDGSSLSNLNVTGTLGVPQYSDPSTGQSNTAEGDIFYSQSDNSLYLNDGA